MTDQQYSGHFLDRLTQAVERAESRARWEEHYAEELKNQAKKQEGAKP